ncbi:MAG: aspartate-semialdehyde dehydrogenase [Parachlamydiaceae bacterium]|nr:aspartate-semialdehyde dehydrogenase [Parachlamydiaceae bacterium]
MGSVLHFRDKVPVVVLGATGSVGQRFIELLAKHPWFEIISISASERSVGKQYKNAVNWLMPTPLPQDIGDMVITPCQPGMPRALVFSALDSHVAGDIESQFAQAGFLVVSNARNHRMQSDVPLLIPEINKDHLELLKLQSYMPGGIVTNPNCSTIGLALALKPLHDRFGVAAVHIVTMQAISGAGYPGVPSMDILDNVIPYINGEEHKIETEPLKILGKLENNHIEPASINISAQCNRVPVSDGHMASVSIKLKTKASRSELIEAWRGFTSEVYPMGLPLAPQQPIHYFEQENYPQPKLHRNLEKGMAVSIGRLRECSIMDFKFSLLSHNTLRGAAGGAVLCGELLLKTGRIFW